MAALGLFIFFLAGGQLFKQPRGESDNFLAYLEKARQEVKNERWDEAALHYNQMEAAWKKVIPRIQYSVERDEINNLNRNLARLKGWIAVKNKPNSIVELEEAEMYWRELGQ